MTIKKTFAKKAQMGMLETIGILIIFFFLLVIGFVFYTQVSMVSLGKDIRERQDLEAVGIALKALSLPDLACPTTMHKDNCVDLLKLEAFPGLIKDNQYYLEIYYDTLKFSTITVTQVYPSPSSGTGVWTIYNNPNPTGSMIFTHMPIVIHDPLQDAFYFGIMNVSYYSPPTIAR
jgi:hypothetical protein